MREGGREGGWVGKVSRVRVSHTHTHVHTHTHTHTHTQFHYNCKSRLLKPVLLVFPGLPEVDGGGQLHHSVH